MSKVDTLVDGFGAVLTEAEDLLKRASQETGEKARELRTEVENKLISARLRLKDLEVEAADRARAVKDATDDFVHEKPWQAVGIAAGVGFIIGLLVSRR